MSFQTLVDMLNKQKLVDSMVQSQQMHKHDMVESLLKKQHDVELQNFIAKQSATELGSYLDVLPLEDAQVLPLWVGSLLSCSNALKDSA